MASSGNTGFQVIAGLAVLSIVFQISTSECSQDGLRQLQVAPMKSSPSLECRYSTPSEFLHLRECRKQWLWQLSLLESLARSWNALLLWHTFANAEGMALAAVIAREPCQKLECPSAMTHLRKCRKRWLWQLSLLESLTRSRNALLLQPGDVEKNHDPVATTNADTQSKKSKFLTVIYMNTRSLIWHFDDFTSLASAEQPHIIAISETWLDSSVTNNKSILLATPFQACS